MRHHEHATWWQGDREISAEDIAYMRTVAKRFPGLSRKELTYTLCEHLDWLTPAGQPKFTACAKLLARLEAAGELQPTFCFGSSNSHPGPQRVAPRRPSARTDPAAPFERPLSAIDPVRLRLASDAQEESLWNDYVERYHPLGYKKPFGYWARYFIESGSHPLGCVLLAGAAKALGARDRWIGWTDRQRLKNLPWVVNNSRYLIFPWVKVANLASHVLGSWPGGSATTGRGAGGIARCCWRPSSTRPTSAAVVTGRPAGRCWAAPAVKDWCARASNTEPAPS